MACILFIDDDPFTLEMLSKAVEVLGHDSIIANSGQEAIKILEERTPDLIFTDMRLPDTDGASLIGQLRSLEHVAQIPIFVLSANPAIDADELVKAAGAQAYLDKPIRLQTLMDIIHAYISE